MSTNTLTYLTENQITDAEATLTGKTLSRPALLATDGSVLIYVVDVDIGQIDPVNHEPVILRNVPVARNNRDLVFANAGTAVTLARTGSGRYMIVGLADEMPGTYTTFTVDLGDFTLGSPTDKSIVGRTLTYGELVTYGVYGLIPYGAIGIFKGGVLQEITT